ncbi:hypothetical protein A3A71_01380 [Candidatus Berkelbacteria bacterium RIFCSPLOWO2_01_FULL_50_28]|uniref:Mechanosensitive ion channel MscS domain-containing protein n=1 Tax=Candidatus Berkelbacteria bacterium RIFCSPLOWO2_01_FULL_50_28 TaxID=1797471 RepID=A0A1F5EBA5_9BACT|nr:MAG: hypothetical protein A2807_01950 [Candidatus Berkelbacteria bacterium RIFCSPHIGHO2_01_FULL_50_36]OGD64000.1 MAG: hypothetical protein A3F39_02920 [Candidatus Berkelbacteria bacterium RIFCSPHIGHO2_12_FULL_50_11]OGD64689.1 MAG: hypothetical protein A3A71_01380 [Candidatus Berkelbacteria bacterium RIFCSPLOWO2_01_FULL_50_28]
MAFTDRIFEILLKAWDKLPALILTVLVGIIIIKLLKFLLHGLMGYSRANKAMKGILLSALDVALWIFLLAALLQQIGLTQIAFALSGSVAIAGIAIASGSSSFVQDLVAGVFLAQDPDFNAGDYVKIDSTEGVVERMDARKVRLRDDKGQLHVYPNSFFDKTAWIVTKRKG